MLPLHLPHHASSDPDHPTRGCLTLYQCAPQEATPHSTFPPTLTSVTLLHPISPRPVTMAPALPFRTRPSLCPVGRQGIVRCCLKWRLREVQTTMCRIHLDWIQENLTASRTYLPFLRLRTRFGAIVRIILILVLDFLFASFERFFFSVILQSSSLTLTHLL